MSSPPLPYFFLSFLFFYSCWVPFALSAFTIRQLPGFNGSLPFHLETGYVALDDVGDEQLFYYFVESEGNPDEDPVLFWLTGGPACSGFSSLAFEIGPMTFPIREYDDSIPTLVPNPYSWTKAASIIFVDSPIGTGFSFSRNPKDYKSGEINWSRQSYAFLRNWMLDHPQFLSNPLYIGGDSYGGKIVPVVAHKIHEGIEAGHTPRLNLKGYLMGNSPSGEKCDEMSQIPMLYVFGMISHEFYESLKRDCEGEYFDAPTKPDCIRDINKLHKILGEVSRGFVLEPRCPDGTLPPEPPSPDRRSLAEVNGDLAIQVPPTPPPLYCKSYGYYLSYQWMNDGTIMDSLHVKKGTVAQWFRCASISFNRDIPSNLPYQLNLVNKGYRALVYSGDHDIMYSFLGTQEWISYLNLSITDDWRSWKIDDQVAGYTRTYSNNFTFATVKGAGHTVPEYKPKECLEMLQRWISHNPL